jgi:hypothetical protein
MPPKAIRLFSAAHFTPGVKAAIAAPFKKVRRFKRLRPLQKIVA